MKKTTRIKKMFCCALAALIALSAVAGCSSSTAGSTAASDASKAAAAPQKVTFWYYHKGDEGAVLEKTIKAFNASQSKYVVEGFSVPDKQKYLVAMSSNESPDLIELSNQDIVSYKANGLLEDLTAMGQKNNFDFKIFSESAKTANTVDGNYFALPYATDIIEMFYNKDLLAKIGAKEPPKTMEELYDMAVKATTLDKNGNIDTLGYPLFPLASARQEGIYAFGGTWVDAATGLKPTANSQGVLDSLNFNVKYRNLYGMAKVQKFVATSNTNRYTPQDIFFAGKQLFRFDGPWLAKMIHDNNPKINYGVTLIPGTKANPELRGVSRYETTSVAIPVGAAQKEGAWALANYIATDGAQDLLIGLGSLPANKNLYNDAKLLSSNASFPEFIEALKADNGVQYPKMQESAKYTALINQYLDFVYNGTKTPKDAMDALQQQASALK